MIITMMKVLSNENKHPRTCETVVTYDFDIWVIKGLWTDVDLCTSPALTLPMPYHSYHSYHPYHPYHSYHSYHSYHLATTSNSSVAPTQQHCKFCKGDHGQFTHRTLYS